MGICCCWVECSITVRLIPLADVVQFFYILGDFFYLVFYQLLKRGVEIVNRDCGFVCFSFSHVNFALCFFAALLFGVYIYVGLLYPLVG